MESKRVTVFGGSGFLGRQIVKHLAAEGACVRVAVRHPERASFLERLGRDGQIEFVHADVWDEKTVARAVKQSASVINTVGHYVEKAGATFDAVHGQGALHVARQAGQAGAKVLIHISGLGADPSDSPYVRARGRMENMIKEHKLYTKSGRTSCHRWEANQFRLFLHTGAYWLLPQLRRAAPRKSPWRKATFETLRRAFLKIAVRINELKSRVRIALPSAYPYRKAMISMAGCIAAQGP